ncbi:hypothetical protein A2U01_0080739, partial [Trifolium medium]|nr:hypothetical protein [Trifolium medium]
VEFSLSPSDRWSVGEDDTIFRRFVECLRFGAKRELGFVLTVDRVHVQQQFPFEYWNGAV